MLKTYIYELEHAFRVRERRPPAASCFVTLPCGRWKRKDAESAPTCRSRVFVRRATAKAGDRYKKRGLFRRMCAAWPALFCAFEHRREGSAALIPEFRQQGAPGHRFPKTGICGMVFRLKNILAASSAMPQSATGCFQLICEGMQSGDACLFRGKPGICEAVTCMSAGGQSSISAVGRKIAAGIRQDGARRRWAGSTSVVRESWKWA